MHRDNPRHLRSAHFKRTALLILTALVLGSIIGSAAVTQACPFCTSLPRTLSDDLEESTAAVIARCESIAADPDGFHVCKMRILEVMKGSPKLKESVVEVITLDPLSKETTFWMAGYGETSTQWATPQAITNEGITYLRSLGDLPGEGPQRLEHFLRFLQHPDKLVADDAYNEFAEATLEDIAGLQDNLDRRWVIAQLQDTSLPRHRRRLCWTFLSQCGLPTDAGLFDDSLKKRQADPLFDPGMDAAIACYITLGGEALLLRIERDYLSNREASYVDAFAAVSAIRVHGTELDVFSRERLSKSLRQLLQRPELADLVIPDLARWGDWSAIDRMEELFKFPTEKNAMLRPATVLYLKNCPLPSAAETLDRLRAIDAKTVRMAESSMLMHSGVASIPVPPPDIEAQEPTESAVPRVAEKQ